jgi:hypothetical protein
MCYEIAGVGWEGNYNFYNNLIPDYWPPLSIGRIEVITSKMNYHKGASWRSIKY